jgi:hypothetical protein
MPLQLIARFVGIKVEGALATPRFSNLRVTLAFKQPKCDCYYRELFYLATHIILDLVHFM